MKTNRDQTVTNIKEGNMAPIIHTNVLTQRPFWVMLTPSLNKTDKITLFVA